MIEQKFDLEHIECSHEYPVATTETKVEIHPTSIIVGFKGFGCGGMETGYGGQILIEIKEGIPRVIVFGNINSEEPTQIIDLTGAKESKRCEHTDVRRAHLTDGGVCRSCGKEL